VTQFREKSIHVMYVNAIMFAKILGGGNCPVFPFLVAALTITSSSGNGSTEFNMRDCNVRA